MHCQIPLQEAWFLHRHFGHILSQLEVKKGRHILSVTWLRGFDHGGRDRGGRDRGPLAAWTAVDARPRAAWRMASRTSARRRCMPWLSW